MPFSSSRIGVRWYLAGAHPESLLTDGEGRGTGAHRNPSLLRDVFVTQTLSSEILLMALAVGQVAAFSTWRVRKYTPICFESTLGKLGSAVNPRATAGAALARL